MQENAKDRIMNFGRGRVGAEGVEGWCNRGLDTFFFSSVPNEIAGSEGTVETSDDGGHLV